MVPDVGAVTGEASLVLRLISRLSVDEAAKPPALRGGIQIRIVARDGHDAGRRETEQGPDRGFQLARMAFALADQDNPAAPVQEIEGGHASLPTSASGCAAPRTAGSSPAAREPAASSCHRNKRLDCMGLSLGRDDRDQAAPTSITAWAKSRGASWGRLWPIPVVVNHDADVVRVAEGLRATVESRVVEIPFRRGGMMAKSLRYAS
jgi:hypothetical protein